MTDVRRKEALHHLIEEAGTLAASSRRRRWSPSHGRRRWSRVLERTETAVVQLFLAAAAPTAHPSRYGEKGTRVVTATAVVLLASASTRRRW